MNLLQFGGNELISDNGMPDYPSISQGRAHTLRWCRRIHTGYVRRLVADAMGQMELNAQLQMQTVSLRNPALPSSSVQRNWALEAGISSGRILYDEYCHSRAYLADQRNKNNEITGKGMRHVLKTAVSHEAATIW